MAFIQIVEHKNLMKGKTGNYGDDNWIPIGDSTDATPLTLSHSTGSVLSGSFSATTRFVRLISDANCFYEIGASPTAVNTSGTPTRYLPAGIFIYEQVSGGHRLAVIATA
jgi:hypothetical protein